MMIYVRQPDDEGSKVMDAYVLEPNKIFVHKTDLVELLADYARLVKLEQQRSDSPVDMVELLDAQEDERAWKRAGEWD
jgi:hypothetical protein